MSRHLHFTLLLILTISSTPSWAPPVTRDSPEAASRSNGQNYKDLVLAECIASAYRDAPKVAADAGSSAAALVEWAYFDLENALTPRRQLIKQYLVRNYQNPLAETEQPGLRFDLLKCLDLYHSDELEAHVKAFMVDRPDDTKNYPQQKFKAG